MFDGNSDQAKMLSTEKRGPGGSLPALLPLSAYPKETWGDFLGENRPTVLRQTDNPDGTVSLECQFGSRHRGNLVIYSLACTIVLRSEILIVANPNAGKFITKTTRELLPHRFREQFPVCAKLEYEVTDTSDGKPVLAYVFEFTEYNDEAVPDDTFRMSNHGIPDPVDAPPPARITSRPVWLLSAAGLLALIAAICRWLVRRRVRATAPPDAA
jgi:hypothetical protein